MTSQGTRTPTGPPGRADRARALLDVVSDLTGVEREAAFGELARICGIDLGEDEQAWAERLRKHPPGNDAPPIPSEKQLPLDEQVLSGLLEVAADEAPAEGNSPEADRRSFPALDGYELLARIGEGGMGTVYKARQVSLKREVAVKVLQDRLAGDEAFISRFMREARLAASLSHPNVVRAIDVGVSGGKYYFAMELVDGETAKGILKREGAIPERRATEIALQVARALDYARTRSLIHRDVKPDNILIDREGAAMLADMGLARAASVLPEGASQITRAATMIGTPDYVSPEQARGQEDVDTRTDVYALGATLFHMVTGRPPFVGESQADVISKHLNEAPPAVHEVNPRIGRGTSLVVRMGMEKDRSRRYATPARMASDLEDILRGEEPRIASAQYGAEHGLRGMCVAALGKLRRSRWGLPALAGAAVAGIALGVVLTSRRSTEVVEEQPRLAVQEEPPYADLVRQARRRIANGDYDEAIALLDRAASLGAAQETEALMEDARYGAHVSAGRASEENGDLASATKSYELALAVRDEQGLRDHVAELKRNEGIRRALTTGDRLLDQGDWRRALGSYRAGLDLARDQERARIEAKVAAAQRRGRYVVAMAKGREALEAREWAQAIAQGETALLAAPEDEQALALVASARRARAREAEERQKQEAYEQAMSEARRALAERAWQDAVARAEAALKAVADDAAAEAVIEQARRGQEQEEAQRQRAYAEKMAGAEEARRTGDWRRVVELTRSALAAKPGQEEARRLLSRAEAELGLEKEVSNSISMTFVLVPAGEFVMGSEDGEKDEGPVHRAFLDSYYIGKHEVTNAQFGRFRPRRESWRDYSSGDDDPAVCVSWEDAVAFCKWLSAEEGVEYRLPTEAEWERAARGADGGTYPWGNEAPDAEGTYRCNFAPGSERKDRTLDGFRVASPVGSFPDGASPFGALDMAGNVWEWCLDRYADAYVAPERENPRGPSEGRLRVLRGGSYTNGEAALRSANRAAQSPGFRDANVGFRCVRVVETGASND